MGRYDRVRNLSTGQWICQRVPCTRDANPDLGIGWYCTKHDAEQHTSHPQRNTSLDHLFNKTGKDDDIAKADEDERTWHEIDLGPAWRGEKPEPQAHVLQRNDGTFLLAAGINYLFGDSGDGKSWVALIASLQCMKAQRHVLWVTYEDVNEVEIVKRLRALGAVETDLDYISVVVPPLGLTTGIGWLGRRTRDRNTALMILDSIGEALAEDAINEDKDAEFGPWARQTLRHLLDVAASDTWADAEGTQLNTQLAILPIDHSTKANDNPFYPSGTKRKRAMVTGTMFMLNVRESFGVDVVGHVQLVTAKDRSGRFRRGEIAAEITMDAREYPYMLEVRPPPAGGSMIGAGGKRKATERVLQVLDASSVAITSEEAHRLSNDPSVMLPGESMLSLGTVRNAMVALAKQPNVSRQTMPTGVGKAVRHLFVVTHHEGDHEAAKKTDITPAHADHTSK